MTHTAWGYHRVQMRRGASGYWVEIGKGRHGDEENGYGDRWLRRALRAVGARIDGDLSKPRRVAVKSSSLFRDGASQKFRARSASFFTRNSVRLASRCAAFASSTTPVS
jgi:hypothetical protein